MLALDDVVGWDIVAGLHERMTDSNFDYDIHKWNHAHGQVNTYTGETTHTPAVESLYSIHTAAVNEFVIWIIF